MPAPRDDPARDVARGRLFAPPPPPVLADAVASRSRVRDPAAIAVAFGCCLAAATSSMSGPFAAVAWSLFVFVVADAAWRIASQLVPDASVSVFLLAAALVGEAIAASTVAVPGLVGCLGLPVVGPWLGLLHLLVRRLRVPPRTLAQVVARAVGEHQFSLLPVAAVVLLVFGTGLVALNQVRYTVQDADSMWY